MTENDLRELMPQLEAYHGRFHDFFCRSEGRKWGMKYLQGLMMPIERKNVENIAEEVGARMATSKYPTCGRVKIPHPPMSVQQKNLPEVRGRFSATERV